jgi:hypothetical protein
MDPEIFDGTADLFQIEVDAYGVLVSITLTGQICFPEVGNAWTFGTKRRRVERLSIPVHVGQHWRQLIEHC